MADNQQPPDYDLADRIALTEPAQVRAISHPLRQRDPRPPPRARRDGHRARSRARAPEEHCRAPRQGARRGRADPRRPHAAGPSDRRAVLRPDGSDVLRRRRARAASGEEMPRDFNDFEVAAHESAAAFRDGKLWGFIRHARITEQQAGEFWQRIPRARRRVRPVAALRRHDVRVRDRRLSH